MQLSRTTVRLRPQLKKAAELKALNLNLTFQALLEKALEMYLSQESRRQAKKIVFHARSVGTYPETLTREDIYAD
ncbi:MAG TPA: hypothetical protein VF209_01375 [Patescibacteria group bacterium]